MSNQILISHIIESSHSHLTAEEVFHKAREVNAKISLGTVYRNLNTLVELGKIRRISSPNAPDRFDNTIPHDHLVCMECGKVIDIEKITCSVGNLPEGVVLDHFEVTSYGLCAECSELKDK